jgi:hypothetical protein
MYMLILLQFKHWYVDFVLQTDAMIKGKGVYGNRHGLWHSAQHAIGTLIIAAVFTDLITSLAVALFDFVAHYHIDWCKMKYGCKDMSNPLFWNHLGLDQMAHQLTYIMIIWYVFA